MKTSGTKIGRGFAIGKDGKVKKVSAARDTSQRIRERKSKKAKPVRRSPG